MKIMGNKGSIAGNGLGGSTHPGADSCAMCGGCMLVRVLGDVRSIAAMHRTKDKDQHHAKDKSETLSICHVITDQKNIRKAMYRRPFYARETRKILSSKCIHQNWKPDVSTVGKLFPKPLAFSDIYL